MSHLFLIMVLALIPFVDALVPFPNLHPHAVPAELSPEPEWQVSDKGKEVDDALGSLGGSNVDEHISELGSVRVSDRGFPGIATYVHPSLSGGLMRDGVTPYDPLASGVAAGNSWPIGTLLQVRGPTGREMLLEIRDTGLLGEYHIDLSEVDFQILVGNLRQGVGLITIREADYRP